MPADLEKTLARAREISLREQGPGLDIYTPGMITAYGRRGRYPAVSITGARCELGCEHCKGRLLETMLPAAAPQELLELGRRLWRDGQAGMLLSGGSAPDGRMPWEPFIPVIARLSQETGLIITAHVGRIDLATARALKEAGVRQALYDVVGEPAAAREILHLPDGLAAQEETLAACADAGLEMVPHIILGLHGGEMRGEEKALEMVAALGPDRVVFVVLMPLKRTPLAHATPPEPEEAARFLALARERIPQARHHLGCARPRGRYRRELDRLAVAAGINALAIPSDGALETAAELGIEVKYHQTCCSLSGGVKSEKKS